jgi:hypothetical protein
LIGADSVDAFFIQQGKKGSDIYKTHIPECLNKLCEWSRHTGKARRADATHSPGQHSDTEPCAGPVNTSSSIPNADEHSSPTILSPDQHQRERHLPINAAFH